MITVLFVCRTCTLTAIAEERVALLAYIYGEVTDSIYRNSLLRNAQLTECKLEIILEFREHIATVSSASL
jgi:hypothetical protein